MFGHKDSITLQHWPTVEETLIDESAELSEELIKNTIEDINNILKVTKIQIQRISIYVPSSWKWSIFLFALKQEQLNLKELIENSLSNPEYSEFKKNIPKFCQPKSSEFG